MQQKRLNTQCVEWQMNATHSTYEACLSFPQRAQAYTHRSLRELVALRAAAHGGYARAIQRMRGDSACAARTPKAYIHQAVCAHDKKNEPFLNSRAVDDHCDVGNSETIVSQQVLSAYLLRCMGVL